MEADLNRGNAFQICPYQKNGYALLYGRRYIFQYNEFRDLVLL